MALNIHKDIYAQLDTYYNENRVPNIIFHGRNGSGKKTIVKNYINKIYKTKEEQKKYVLIVDCIQSNGIKFIREELKFFAKSNIQHNICKFKSIILLNADKLTIDAQSALRRCIEQYSHTTRFFIIVLNTDKLLKPIISRFCNIYIPKPILNNKIINNMHLYNKTNILTNDYYIKKNKWLENKLYNFKNYKNIESCMLFVEKLWFSLFSKICNASSLFLILLTLFKKSMFFCLFLLTP